ncbi:HAD-IA family hydrolase [Ideonella paludis]|uniref:HAD-IA family hydrolase n=1 Tax=Ideonella paludis TaxID=1233411 RepID=A0ABS5DWR4_9BURK|nr:HAD-IA family hydrolase [Ideonella paludis]MBQ0935316.1 HAD-IA family hydrolase [Ideonella paludis]
MSELQCLLWDVDGTIAETERDGHRVAFNRAFAQAGLDWGWDERRYGALLHITGGRERILADMADREGVPRDPVAREELALRLHRLKNKLYAALVDEGGIQARPGVLGLMREARAAGVRQGIVTTTSRSNVQALLGRLLGADWQAWFEIVVCGEDTQRKKPDPEAYVQALQALGLEADQAVAMEDSGPGVAAALAAGLQVWWRPSVYFPVLEEAVLASPRVAHWADGPPGRCRAGRVWQGSRTDA